MKGKQIIRDHVYVVLFALLFIATLGFGTVSAEASTSRDSGMELVAAPVSVDALFGGSFRIHKEFTLNFNSGGGSGSQSAVFSSTGSIKLPECRYSKTGYHFTGWKIGSRVYSAGSNFACDSYGSTTATAQWAANSYTVKYNANGGSGSMANTSATYGSSFNLRYNSFSRTGYSFAGWSCNGTNYSDHASVKNLTSTNGGSVTMYARWSPKSITIYFEDGGGYGSQSPIYTSYGSSVTLPVCSFARDGYHFTGWKINGTVYSAGSSISNPCTGGQVAATAQWAVNTYTIAFSANGGSGSMGSITAAYGTAVTLPANGFSKTGSSFTGWICNGNSYGNGASVKNLTSSHGATVTMTAQWKANSYTIVFEENGGTGTQSPLSTTYGATVTLPACSFARTGYRFAGWKINGKVYNAGDKVQNLCTGGQVAATAQWTPITYTIAFAANGGSGTMSSITLKYDETKALPKCAFSITGSSCTGWTWNGKTYANGASVKNLTSTNGATLTFTAQWKVNSYTIVFEENGGTGTQSNISTTYGATVTLPACSFARTGYTFAGWKINGTVYKAGDKVKNLCTGGQVVATAQWTPITYTIAFAANGGSGTMSSITLKYDETKALPKCAFSITGSSCTGWTWNGKTYANGASVKNLTSTNGATLTFTAQWKVNSYTIVFEENGGTGTQSNISTTYGATVTLPACSFARTGYTFAGWKINGKVYKAGDKVKNLVTGGQVAATAQWTPITYTIAFAANGGSGTMSSITLKYDETKALPKCAFSITGSSCTGWKWNGKTYANGASVKNLTSTNGATLTFTAQWKVNSYTIVFEENGGTGTQSPLSTTYGATVTLPACSFARTGYTFAGWKINGTVYKAGDKVKNLCTGGQVVATAQWKGNPYTITFAANGGTGTQASISTTYGTTVTLPACSYTRTGYTFAGWKIGSKVYKAGDKVKNLVTSGKIAATAQWTANTYTIVFAANGGTGSMSKLTVKYDETKKLPKCSFSKAGSTFANWKWNDKTYANGASVKNLTSTNGATLTFTAQWKANSYTIVFEENGGTGTQANISTTYGATVTLPACSFARTGYTFAGWKINGTVYKAGDKVKNLCTGGQVVATAQWTPITYTIAFAANGGTGTMSSITLKYDETKALPKCAFSYTGSSFTGWKWNGKTYANGASVKNLTSTNGATLTFTAQWKANSYTIVFEENGGTGTQANISTTYGATVTLPVCSFARTGYSFAGWKINGTVYKAGDKVKNLCTGGQVVATAQWKGNPYTIVFAANGGTGKQSSVNTTYGETVTLPACSFTRTGCSFAGWRIGSKVYKAGEKVKNLCTDDQVVAIAQWKGNPYTIVFEENGGTGTQANISTMYSATVTLPACSFTRTGYSFAGWKINGTVYKAGDRVKNLCTGGQVVATAQWKGNTYTVQFDPSGGVGNMDDQVMVYGTSKKLSLNTFTKTGYTFAGWTRTKGSTTINLKDEQAVATLASRQGQVVTLYAVWHRNPTYSLIFNPMGGTGYMEQEYFVWGVPQKIQKNQFKYFGKVFVGWSKTRNGTKADYVDEQVVSSVIKQEGAVVELFAVWKDSTTYTLRFNSNGGTGTMADQPMTYDVSESIRVNTFKKKGYYFAGWSLTKDPLVKKYSDGQFVSRVTATDKAIVTLYAIWEVAPVYKVRFDSNGGSGLMSIQQHVYGESTALTKNAFKRTGYTFMGWSTDKKATTATYRDEQPVKNLSSTNGETIILYAIWSQNKYSIIYYPNNGTPALKTVAMKGGKEVVIEANTFEKSNSEFVLWNTKSDGTGTCYTAGQTLKKGFDAQNNETIRLFAQWRSDRITSTDKGKTFKYEAWLLPNTYLEIPFVLPNNMSLNVGGLYKCSCQNSNVGVTVNGITPGQYNSFVAGDNLKDYAFLAPAESMYTSGIKYNMLGLTNKTEKPQRVVLSFTSDQTDYVLDGHTSVVYEIEPYMITDYADILQGYHLWEVYICADDVGRFLTLNSMRKAYHDMWASINQDKIFEKQKTDAICKDIENLMWDALQLDDGIDAIMTVFSWVKDIKSLILDIFPGDDIRGVKSAYDAEERLTTAVVGYSASSDKKEETITWTVPHESLSEPAEANYNIYTVNYGVHFRLLVSDAEPGNQVLLREGNDTRIDKWDGKGFSARPGTKGVIYTSKKSLRCMTAMSKLEYVDTRKIDDEQDKEILYICSP